MGRRKKKEDEHFHLRPDGTGYYDTGYEPECTLPDEDDDYISVYPDGTSMNWHKGWNPDTPDDEWDEDWLADL